MDKKVKSFKSKHILILSLILINLIIITISVKYYNLQKEIVIEQKLSQLKNIADTKSDQILDWRKERYSDARYLYNNSQITESFKALLNDTGNIYQRKLLRNTLNGMFLNGKYASMIALDKAGRRIVSLPPGDSYIQLFSLPSKSELHSSHNIVVGDIRKNNHSISTMQIIIPKYELLKTDTNILGWLVLNIDLEQTFFRIIENMPVSIESIGVIFYYYDNNEIIPLNKSELWWEFKLNYNKLSDSKKSKDDGKNPILIANMEVEGTNILVSVIQPKWEALAEAGKIKYVVILLTAMLIITISSVISFFWLKQKNEMIKLETEKKIISERFEILSRFANDAIIIFTSDQTIIQVNDMALELYGYTRPEFLGMNVALLKSPDMRNEVTDFINNAMTLGGYRSESYHIKKNGEKIPVECTLRYMDVFGSHCFQGIIRDISQRKRFEKALVESEERLKLITNTVPQIVWTARPNGTFDFVNSRLKVLTGIQNEDSLASIIHKDDYRRVLKYWRNAINDIREHQVQLRLKMKDGSYRWFLCNAIPLCNKYGQIEKWYGSATDIDELENLVSKRTAELSDLYNNAPCGYFTIDSKGIFVKINDTALNWIGYKRQEVIDKMNFRDLITPESCKLFDNDLRSLSDKGSINNIEYEMIRKDSTHFPVLLNSTAIKDINDQIIMTRTTIIDHTAKKHHENEIIKLNSILQEHSNDLENINKELEAFSFSVSHDLRAPLRAIKGFSRILLDNYKNKLDEEGQLLIEKVLDNSNKMTLLIDDLLRLSRASRHELSCTRIDMVALFNSLIKEAKQIYNERSVNFILFDLPFAYGDLALLKQVISNLISNAIKFSSNKNQIDIEIGSIKENNESTYYIKDHGVGFDMKFEKDLFGVFHRLSNAENFEGTGVGLAIVKRIIDKHGGKVWANSEPGKGATFYFSIPYNKNY